RVTDGAGERGCAAPLAESFGEHEGGREQHRARIRDAVAGERVGDAVGRTEDARCGRSEAAPGDSPSVCEACRDLDCRARELGRADDDVKAFRLEDERAHRALRREPLDLEAVMTLFEARGFALPALVDADEGDPAAALTGEREGPFERPLPGLGPERREDRQLGASLEANAGDRGWG